MNKDKKPFAYYRKVVRNSMINEFRQNANAGNHIVSVGDDLYSLDNGNEVNENTIERQIEAKSPEDWLMFIENSRLHEALKHLTNDQLALLFQLNVKGYSQTELAEIYGITPPAINFRLKTIYRKIKKYLEKP